MSPILPEEQPENLWIEVEVREADDGLNCYCGLANKKRFDQIVNAETSCPVLFLRLDHVYWIKTDQETEWSKESQQVVECGKGRYGNQNGCMYFRVANIILISELKGGAELQRKYLNQK
jgi:hypothetical protein